VENMRIKPQMTVGKPSMHTNIETTMLAPDVEKAVMPQPLPRGSVVYQPDDELDRSHPPQGGSGVPPRAPREKKRRKLKKG
jgi:hypothetical protein